MKIVPHTVFDSECTTIVNTINTVGVMGAGLALEFRLRVPQMNTEYIEKCKNNEISVGKYWLFQENNQINKKILNFPTKKHFRHPSKREYLFEGLEYFRSKYKEDNIKSIAFPLMGSRNGKMDPTMSLFIMEECLSDLDIEVEICQGYLQDSFTYFIKNMIRKADLSELSKSAKINIKYLEKIRENINDIRFLSDLVSKKIITINKAEKLYNYGFLQLKDNKIYNYI